MKLPLIATILTTAFIAACSQTDLAATVTTNSYEGSASLSRGLAKTEIENVYVCERGRKTDIGSINSSDGKTWTVPAATHLLDTEFPIASDLNNPCNGNSYQTASEALGKLDGSDIIEVNVDGEVYTAYIFADNYFEMYINGIAVGRDPVPFTQFNSNIIRFKAKPPFTVAMHLVDWEENLGIGSESNRGSQFHAGDGGVVAVIKNEGGKIIAKTDENWKAQTFYTAPIRDLACVSESGSKRLSNNCSTTPSREQNGAADYALHWALPENWQQKDFDDSNWPIATSYTNKEIGVDNKPAYTNFTDIFDDTQFDALFIWSSNVVLDNEVIVRYQVDGL